MLLVDGRPVQPEISEELERMVTLYTAEKFITCRGEEIPCKILTAKRTSKIDISTLAGGNDHFGYYEPETKTLYEYRKNDEVITVIYQLPGDILCCERDPHPGEEFLRVRVQSHELSDLLKDSNRGTCNHTLGLQ